MVLKQLLHLLKECIKAYKLEDYRSLHNTHINLLCDFSVRIKQKEKRSETC